MQARDTRPGIRTAALLALLAVEPADDGLLTAVRELSVESPEPMIRAEALVAIARARLDDPEIAEFLLDRAVRDEDAEVRVAATRAAALLPTVRPAMLPDLTATA